MVHDDLLVIGEIDVTFQPESRKAAHLGCQKKDES